MSTTRRAVLTMGTLSGLAALVPSHLRAASDFFLEPSNTTDGEWWMLRSVLEPQVGTAFGLRGSVVRAVTPSPAALAPSRSLETSVLPSFALKVSTSLRLDAVTGLAGQEDRDESFSAQFSGPADQGIPQGIYTFRHPTLGSFDAFLVPVGIPGSRQSYELIVNRGANSEVAPVPAPKPVERAAPVAAAAPAPAATPAALDRSPLPVGKRSPKIGTLE